MQYRSKLQHKLENCKSAGDFWKEIHSFRNPQKCINDLSLNDWKQYFNLLLNAPQVIDDNHLEHVNAFMKQHTENCNICNEDHDLSDLNINISIEEIEHAISKLKNAKAPGIDGITNECIKKSSPVLIPLLHHLFNCILETGTYPDSWCEAVIIPIHKKVIKMIQITIGVYHFFPASAKFLRKY